jgi:hypothetical protein
MAIREKRSVSLPPEVAAAVDAAASAEGTTMSAWLADAALRRLRVDRGLRAMAEWEAEHGAFTAEELAEADEVVARVLAP